MPHGNKVKRINPKKKGKASSPGCNGTGGVGSPGKRSVISPHKLKPFQSYNGNSNGNDSRKPRALLQNSEELLYIRYKKSTLRFKEALQALVPPDFFHTDSVNAIMDAADYVVEHNIPVDDGLLNDLKLSIRVRQRMAQKVYGGHGDEGHAYFIAVLQYCYSRLLPLKQTPMSADLNGASVDSASAVNNRFEKLSVEDEGDDYDDDYGLDDSDELLKPAARPPTTPLRLTLQQLIMGTDRSDTILFLVTLDELMRFNVAHWHKLKDLSTRLQNGQHSPSFIVENMMEASVTANLAIQQVTTLEQVFFRDHVHLTTVYRMLANLILVELIPVVTALVTRKSPLATQFTERHAVEFLGDALECFFRTATDPGNKTHTLVPAFLKQWQFFDDEKVIVLDGHGEEQDFSVQLVFEAVQAAAAYEVPLGAELELLSQHGGMQPNNSDDHVWLPDEYIGSNRSILHTIRLLQGLSYAVKQSRGRLMTRRGVGGWANRTEPATRIQFDMDELLMADLLPSLVNMCYEGTLSADLPYQDELLTGFVQIKAFVKNPEQPVSWSLAFTVHTILMSIFEIQEPEHAIFLADAAKHSFEKFFEQLDWVEGKPATIMARTPPIWKTNIEVMLSLRHLVHVNMERSPLQTRLSIWNPYCAGMFLSYIAYYGNLEGGTTLVDAGAQLRMTLHLFNALLQVKMLRPGQVHLLDRLYDIFANCKAVWEGPFPVKGQFENRWWAAFGRNFESSSSASSVSANRELTPIALEHLSKSFRRICLCDFDDVVDRYHNKKQRSKSNHLYQHAVRVNDTLDAMLDDEPLLATNLITLSFFLNQFYVDLFKFLGWAPTVEQIVKEAQTEIKKRDRADGRKVDTTTWEASDEYRKYHCRSYMFAQRIMGSLDAGDTSVATLTAAYMMTFFDKVPRDKVEWFSPKGVTDD